MNLSVNKKNILNRFKKKYLNEFNKCTQKNILCTKFYKKKYFCTLNVLMDYHEEASISKNNCCKQCLLRRAKVCVVVQSFVCILSLGLSLVLVFTFCSFNLNGLLILVIVPY